MAKLTDTQLIVLSAALQRDDHLVVVPENLKGGAAKALVTKLLNQRLVREVRVKRDQPHWTTAGSGHSIGLKITKGGLTAIAVEPEGTDAGRDQDPAASSEGSANPLPAETGSAPRAGTKQALVISLLEREQGATLDDLTAATDWLPHTTRAALTGLRKKGHDVTKSKGENGKTVYHLSMALASTNVPSPAFRAQG
jgi:hypothetical protein